MLPLSTSLYSSKIADRVVFCSLCQLSVLIFTDNHESTGLCFVALPAGRCPDSFQDTYYFCAFDNADVEDDQNYNCTKRDTPDIAAGTIVNTSFIPLKDFCISPCIEPL